MFCVGRLLYKLLPVEYTHVWYLERTELGDGHIQVMLKLCASEVLQDFQSFLQQISKTRAWKLPKQFSIRDCFTPSIIILIWKGYLLSCLLQMSSWQKPCAGIIYSVCLFQFKLISTCSPRNFFPSLSSANSLL
jgi:hypothetical protein